MTKRGQFLDEVSAELGQFTQQAAVLDAAHAQLAEQSDGRELARMPAEELRSRLEDLARYRCVGYFIDRKNVTKSMCFLEFVMFL